MSNPYARAPHIESPTRPFIPSASPNAALLIDFDNVTMGMRSDLSRELKSLLNSDIIKGKVTVQRAYADWRRYPQYIVPLSEASIDLIFAPAYGSSKKNATDIRMAIDGMELVFTRPEIGTYILLTGDSDFSSLVLKLKEYGKYVIGVGIQESSSDILVQNCDEYYSYTSLSGLRRTSDGQGSSPQDPWGLVEKAVEQMVKRGDIMRSDRLKQVMLELDSGFDEKGLGFSKFSRFLTEAQSKGLMQLQKMENGQYEILPRSGAKKATASEEKSEPRRGGRGRERGNDSNGRTRGREESTPVVAAPQDPTPPAAVTGDADAGPQVERAQGTGGREALEPAYALMRKALDELLDDQSGESVRDSDVKRRMLALDSSFDESNLGFSKFSLFLRQAHDHEVIHLRKGEEGNYHVSPGTSAPASPAGRAAPPAPPAPSRGRRADADAQVAGPPATQSPAPRVGTEPPAAPKAEEFEVEGGELRRLRPRLSSRRKGGEAMALPLEGQIVSAPGTKAAAADSEGVKSPPVVTEAPASVAPSGEVMEPEALRLPTERDSVIQYLTNSYKGVGKKTAETVVDAFGRDLFKALQADPGKVAALLPPARAEKLIEGWEADFIRRRDRAAGGTSSSPEAASSPTAEDEPSDPSGGQTRRRPRRTRGGRSSS